MGKQKTTFVWILLVLLALYLIFATIDVVFSIINIQKLLTPALFSNPVVNIISLALSVLSLIIWAIFYTKLYNVKPDVIRWVHIAFGFSVFSLVFGLILSFYTAGLFALLASPLVLIFLIVEVLMWVGISMHLKRAQREKLMDFS